MNAKNLPTKKKKFPKMEEYGNPVAHKCREEREVPHIMRTCSPTLFVCLITTFLPSLPNNTPCLVWCVWESQHVCTRGGLNVFPPVSLRTRPAHMQCGCINATCSLDKRSRMRRRQKTNMVVWKVYGTYDDLILTPDSPLTNLNERQELFRGSNYF